MKPLQSSNTLVSSVGNTTAFGMKTSAETFEIFSSQIYEHKIRAIIRELSCNAYDAHVDAGKRTVPFRIHFPTIFEPFFEVEDYGVGLDDYDIRGEEKVLYDQDGNEASRYMDGGIYTTYFASTKRESNESIGHLGLGSKSPMAYTKSMTVVARKNGIERHYVCFIGENGQPQTTFNSEKQTDQCNGVKIRFSVAAADFEEFQREAAFVLSLFTVKPETNIDIETLLNSEEIQTLNDEGVLLIPNTHPFVNHEPANVYANMGGVVYPVRNLDYYYLSQSVLVNEDAYNTGEDDEAIYHTFDKATVNFIQGTINRGGRRMVVNYPIGDLSFMPSREGLSQDTKTKFNFYKGLIDVFHDQVAELSGRINAATTPLEAVNIFGEFAPPTDLFAFDYEYKGKTVASIFYDHLFDDIRKNQDAEVKNKLICHYKDYVGQTAYSRHNGNTCVRKNQITSITIGAMHDVMEKQKTFECFYANEEGDYKGMAKAIRFYANKDDVEDAKRTFYFYAPVEDDVFDSFSDAMGGNVTFRHISELVDEVKAIDPEFFDKKKRVNGKVVRASKKNETKTKMFRFDKKQNKVVEVHTKVLVDLSKMNPDATAWINIHPNNVYSSTMYHFNIGDREFNLNSNSVRDLMKELGINVLLIADGINMKRIEKSKILNIGTVVQNAVNQRYTELFNQAVLFNVDSVYKQDDEDIEERLIGACVFGYTHRSTLNYLYNNDIEYTHELLYDLIEEFKAKRDTLGKKGVSSNLLRYLDPDEVVNVSNEYDDFYQDLRSRLEKVGKSIKKRYPLLFGVDSDQDAVLEYVELVNEKNRKQHMKVA